MYVKHPNVKLGNDCIIEEFSVIGAPVSGEGEPFPETIIGNGARIRSHTVIYAGNIIGARLRTGNKANIREFNVIGDNVSIGTLSVVEHHVRIGSGTRIHTQVFIPEYTIIEENVWIGPNVVMTNARFPNTIHTKENLEGPTIREGARIGANCTILPGVEIGAYSLIGAASVLTRDAVPHGIYMGSPASRRGWVCNCGLPLEEGDEGLYKCTECGRTFREIKGTLEELRSPV